MHHVPPRARLLAGVMALLLALGVALPTIAQEATPAIDEVPQGISFEPVALAPGLSLPVTGELGVARVSLEPGAGFPLEPGDPAYALVIMERGRLTVRLDAPLMVTRVESLSVDMAEETGDTFVPATETVAAGQEVTLRAGDTALFPPEAGGEVRNAGRRPAVALAIFVGPGAPAGTPVAGTPTP